MKYKNITEAKFIKRINRFVAEVEIDGRVETVHVKNTGRCRELLIPNCEVWLTAPGTPDRKTKYDLVTVRKSDGVLYNIDSQVPNKVVREWLDKQDYSKVIPEYTYGNSRIDFYMEKEENGNTEKYLMEIKGCTLEINGMGYFPDAPTERGVKHIRELIKAKKEDFHSAIAFVIQMDGVSEVRPHKEMDPEFAKAMDDAGKVGVDILFFLCHVESDSIEIVDWRKRLYGTSEAG
jgi:sugar fermentation stimulation protein